MTHSVKLPDAMPEISVPTLLIVCDAHHCRLIDVGGHTLIEQEQLDSVELTHSDRQDITTGFGGAMAGIGDEHHAEDHRLTGFAKMILEKASAIVVTQKIEAIYLSAPSKMLSEIKKHLSGSFTKILKSTIDGTFMKESATDILLRFCPDLKISVQELRDQENYSSKKHLPK